MRPEIVSFLFGVAGTCVGFVLSELGLGIRGWQQRKAARRQMVLDLAAAVLEASMSIATMLSKDFREKFHGEVMPTEQAAVFTDAFNDALGRMRLLLLRVEVECPDVISSRATQVSELVDDAMAELAFIGRVREAQPDSWKKLEHLAVEVRKGAGDLARLSRSA